MQALFQSAQHLSEKREGSGAGYTPLTNGPGFGRPKNMRIRLPNIVTYCTSWSLIHLRSLLRSW